MIYARGFDQMGEKMIAIHRINENRKNPVNPHKYYGRLTPLFPTMYIL